MGLGPTVTTAERNEICRRVAGWNMIDFTWTVGSSAPAVSSVKLAIANTGASALTFKVDDVSVWDAAPRSASQPNQANVPSSVTVFDARGKVIKSIGAPAYVCSRGMFRTPGQYNATNC
jgi:hypothetical protein